MAVDTTLVQGAYEANKPQKVIGVDEIDNIGGAVSGLMNQYMADKKAQHTKHSEEYETYAQDVLANSDLVGDQYEALYDELMTGKDDYANSDKKNRDLKLRDLQAMSSDYEDYKALREEVAVNIKDYSPSFTNSEEGKMYLEILKGEGKTLANNNGRIGVEVDGEWKSISSIKQELDNHKIDKTSQDTLEAFRIKEQGDSTPFNRKKTRTSILNGLIANGSYESLKNDEIIPGRVFINDLAEDLMNNTYGNLGITVDDLAEVEGVNISDGIDVDEAENIISHLEANETEMKEIMADYYTTYLENNIVKKKRTKTEINNSYGYTNAQALANQQQLKDLGFDIEVDGEWSDEDEDAKISAEAGMLPELPQDDSFAGEENKEEKSEKKKFSIFSPSTWID